MSSIDGRNLGICVEDTPTAAETCRWTVEHLYREGDVLHLLYVIKSLKPPMEVFHQLPGTSYSFDQPGGHHEEEKIRAAKRAIEKRFLPLLQRREPIPYQLHLFAEKYDAQPDIIGKDLVKCAESIPCDVVILSHHRKDDCTDDVDRFEGQVAKVNDYVSHHCSKPICIV